LKWVKDRWVPEITQHCPGVPIILVGTKLDLRNKPDTTGILSLQDAEKMAKQIRAITLIECSALTQEKLADVFQQTIRAVINPSKLKEASSSSGDKDNKETKPKKITTSKNKTPNKTEKKKEKEKNKGFFGGSKKKKEKV